MNRRQLVMMACATLAGCAGTQFSWDQARGIKVGMTEAELTAVMGRPHTVKSAAGKQTWVWVWVDSFQGTKSVSAVLENGRVVEAPSIPESFR